MPEIMVRFDDLRIYCEKRHVGSVPLEYIKQMKTIEAEPVRHGQWIEDHTDLICSVCKWKYSDELPFMSNHGLDSMTEAFARCPHCGAKMYADGGTISKERFAEIMRGDDNA